MRKARSPSESRRPKNTAEGAFFDFAKQRGLNVSKRGWPDFFCWTSEGEIVVVEVKPTARRGPKANQLLVLKTLAAAGIPCFLWDPESGLRPIDP